MKRLTALAILSMIPAISLADERPYASPMSRRSRPRERWSWNSMRPCTNQHGGELEPDWVHQLEFGYGITEQFDVAAYAVFRTTPTTSFEPAPSSCGVGTSCSTRPAPRRPGALRRGREGRRGLRALVIEEKADLRAQPRRLSWAVNLVAEQDSPAVATPSTSSAGRPAQRTNRSRACAWAPRPSDSRAETWRHRGVEAGGPRSVLLPSWSTGP